MLARRVPKPLMLPIRLILPAAPASAPAPAASPSCGMIPRRPAACNTPRARLRSQCNDEHQHHSTVQQNTERNNAPSWPAVSSYQTAACAQNAGAGADEAGSPVANKICRGSDISTDPWTSKTSAQFAQILSSVCATAASASVKLCCGYIAHSKEQVFADALKELNLPAGAVPNTIGVLCFFPEEHCEFVEAQCDSAVLDKGLGINCSTFPPIQN
ncbi:hypothetical protein GGX14DRAFT_594989 [Mycena pura]|uniref:Hydrophobin n=1 Tax=Mycena pura TaxID=153505 RepID=A0AAD6YHY8_9AGAR|nr:hypothetical protein GGX14DRAFT_594989 [Mycena pura]